MMNKRLKDIINESGAGLWGTDKARERLQQDTPGQEIKSLVKSERRVTDIDVEQAARDLKHAKLKKAKDKVQNEDVKNPYTKYDSQKLQQLKKKMRDNVANLTQRVRMRNSLSGNASQSMKDELKDLERKSKLIDLAIRDGAKQSDAKRAGVGSSDKETFRDRQARLGKPQTEEVAEGSFYGRDDLVKQFATPKKDRHKFIKLRKTDSSGTSGVSMKRDGNEDKIKDYLSKGYKEVPVESVKEGSESWEDGYKRRVVKTTKPEHKDKGYNWRIKGKDKAHLTIKLYKDKPSQAEFNKQMKRVAGHEFGG